MSPEVGALQPPAPLAAPVTESIPVERKPALTHRASLNAVQSLLDYSAKLLVGFLITPLLVSELGRSLYGVWQMLSSLIGYMSATDGRPTEALRLVISSRQASDDVAGHRRAVGSALVVWIAFLPLVLVVAAVLIWLAPGLTKVGPAYAGTVRLTGVLLLLAFLLAGIAAVPESVLRGMNLGYKRMGLQAGLSIIGGGLTALAVTRGFGLPGLAGAQVALLAITGIIFWVLARRYVPWFGFARPTRPEVRTLLSISLWIAGGELIAKLAIASDVVILGALISASAVTIYVLTGYAAQLALGLHILTASAAMPGLGAVIGQRDLPRARQLRAELLALTWVFGVATGATILLCNRSFVTLWIGAQNYAGLWVNLLIVLTTLQTILVRSDAYVLDAALQPRPRVIVAVAAAVVIVGLSFVLTPWLGIAGICLGMLLGRAIQSVAYPSLASRALGGPRRPALRPIIRPALATVLLFGFAGVAGERTLAPNWFAFAGLVPVSFVLLLAAALYGGLTADIRGRMVARARAAWKGLRRG